MVTRRTRRILLAIAILGTAATAIAVPATRGGAASPKPGLRLLAGARHFTIGRYGAGDFRLYLPETVYVAATNGAFEIDARNDHGKVTLEQVSRHGGKVTKLRAIKTAGPADFRHGFPAFFHLQLTDGSGKVFARSQSDFCPTADYDAQRVSASGADNPHFPQFCGDHLTKSTVWGIDDGWAVGPFLRLSAPSSDVPDGTYTLTVAVGAPYAHEFGIATKDRSVSFTVNLKTHHGGGGCSDICPAVRQRAAARPGSARQQRQRLRGATQPTPVQRNNGGLPDLAALPAHGISTSHERKSGNDFLNFGATIWNAGPGTFDIEGFRHNGRHTMRARQFIYRHGHSTQSMNIGHFEFDSRKGHHHWHLEDVARYDLLNAGGKTVVRSHKQSFCLAPTDPIDLTAPGALWNPYSIGLASSCPTEQSLWLRENLPVGWGDTYIQRKGGQAFDITDVPNGHYEIRVTANPFGRIHEVTRKNNSAMLAVELGGTPGQRTVTKLGPVH